MCASVSICPPPRALLLHPSFCIVGLFFSLSQSQHPVGWHPPHSELSIAARRARVDCECRCVWVCVEVEKFDVAPTFNIYSRGSLWCTAVRKDYSDYDTGRLLVLHTTKTACSIDPTLCFTIIYLGIFLYLEQKNTAWIVNPIIRFCSVWCD